MAQILAPEEVATYLKKRHYLGPSKRGFAYQDEFGVIIFAKPTSRRLPQDGTWLELVRWCLRGYKNDGSRQWKRAAKWLRINRPEVTTIVSYSDPSVGHTGALYKACNWIWAPTWLRLRPPPTGNGTWKTKKVQAVKDRWVFRFKEDARRMQLLPVNDEALRRKGLTGYQE